MIIIYYISKLFLQKEIFFFFRDFLTYLIYVFFFLANMIKIDTILSMKKTKLENNEAIITKPRENLIESSENIDYPKPDQSLIIFLKV